MCTRWVIGSGVISLVVAAGCNRSGLNLADVEGVVTYQGQPVAKAGVVFQPASGPYAMGTTDEEGKFTLNTANHSGAVIGEHRVGITKVQTLATQVAGERMPRYSTKYFLPEKYASPSTSELTATVSKKKRDNQFKFELTGKVGGGT
jgi:hypothetical protein